MGTESTAPAAKTATEMVDQVANDTEATDLNNDSKTKLREKLKTDLDTAKDKQIHWSQRERADFVNQMKTELGKGNTATDNLDKVADLLKREIETEVFETEMDAAAKDYEGADSDAAETDDNPARQSIEQTYKSVSAELDADGRKELKTFLKEKLATAHAEGGWIDKTVSTAEATKINKAIVIKAIELQPSISEQGETFIKNVATAAGVAVAEVTGWLSVKATQATEAVTEAISTPEAKPTPKKSEAEAATAAATENMPVKPAADRLQAAEAELSKDYIKPAGYDPSGMPTALTSGAIKFGIDQKNVDSLNKMGIQTTEADLEKAVHHIFANTESISVMKSILADRQEIIKNWFTEVFPKKSDRKKEATQHSLREETLQELLKLKGIDKADTQAVMEYIAFGNVETDLNTAKEWLQAKKDVEEADTNKTPKEKKYADVNPDAAKDIEVKEHKAEPGMAGMEHASKEFEHAMDAWKRGDYWGAIKGFLGAFGQAMSGLSKMILSEVPDDMAELPLIGGIVTWAKKREAADKAKVKDAETAAVTLTTSLETDDKLSKEVVTALSTSELTMDDFKTNSEQLKTFKEANKIADDNAEFKAFTKKITDGYEDKNKTTTVWTYLLAKQEAKK